MTFQHSREESIDILARTLYGEARGEPLNGMEAVATVVMNRVRRGGWFGKDVISVCLKPYQFSCWNKGDPNFSKIHAVSADDPVFATCKRVAARAVSGTLPDAVRGATHYHTLSCNPKWSLDQVPVAQIGNHLFYKEV